MRVHDRRGGANQEGREQHPQGNEKCQGPGKLSQSFVAFLNGKRTASDHPAVSRKVAAKDEFYEYQECESRDDMMAAPRATADDGIIPNTGGFGVWKSKSCVCS